jgi:hypothetical protein
MPEEEEFHRTPSCGRHISREDLIFETELRVARERRSTSSYAPVAGAMEVGDTALIVSEHTFEYTKRTFI